MRFGSKSKQARKNAQAQERRKLNDQLQDLWDAANESSPPDWKTDQRARQWIELNRQKERLNANS